jgi:hypothetical protein
MSSIVLSSTPPIDETAQSLNVNVLAYHYCTFYNEVDHTNHWDLARKMGLIKE